MAVIDFDLEIMRAQMRKDGLRIVNMLELSAEQWAGFLRTHHYVQSREIMEAIYRAMHDKTRTYGHLQSTDAGPYFNQNPPQRG